MSADTPFSPDLGCSESHIGYVGGDLSATPDLPTAAPQDRRVGGGDSSSANGGAKPNPAHAEDGPPATRDNAEFNLPSLPGGNSDPSPSEHGATPILASTGEGDSISTDQLGNETRITPVGVGDPSPSTVTSTEPMPVSPEGEELRLLRVYASGFHDAQQARIALGNRLKASAISPDLVKDLEKGMRDTEAALQKRVVGTFKRLFPELAEWAENTPGIGINTVALLCGTIGDPYIARPHHWEPNPEWTEGSDKPKRILVPDPPFVRKVSQLWAYCGVGDPERKRRVGMSAEDAAALGNQRAKVVIHRIMISTFMQNGVKGVRSPYRDLADELIAEYEQTRPDWRPIERQGAALRKVKKAILKDIWLVQRDAHMQVAAAA